MKSIKILIISILLIFTFFLYRSLSFKFTQKNNINSPFIKVAIIYNKSLFNEYKNIIYAYEEVLKEEGVPFVRVDIDSLLSCIPSKDFIKKVPAIIFPDSVDQEFPVGVNLWLEDYLKKGGSIFISYDVGVKNTKGYFISEGFLKKLLGINNATYNYKKERFYLRSYVRIINKEFLEIPPGKIDEEGYINGYLYGRLIYPIINLEVLNKDYHEIAEAITKSGLHFPAIIFKRYYKGYIYYVNLPLGLLKTFSDELFLRICLRSFLFKFVKIPHICNTPYAKGGLVINWHVDANPDLKAIPYMLKNNFFRKNIHYSIHITAGDFCYKPGDNLGFDACGKGRSLVKIMMNYGIIGSHGGWGHNWFSDNIIKGIFKEKEIYKYILKNNKCLESITGYKIIEYSSPNGVHPQPVMTKVLEKLGIIAYYYTGDSGSFPNFTFYNGTIVSKKVIAFPILNYKKWASLHEMAKSGISEEETEEFLINIVNYVIKNRTIRLFYSHPYDIPYYHKAFKNFLNYIEIKEKNNQLFVEPMSYFANFLFKFLKTKYYFFWDKDNSLKIALYNKKGLKGIAIAVPKKFDLKKITKKGGVKIEEEKNYFYISFTRNYKKKILFFITH